MTPTSPITPTRRFDPDREIEMYEQDNMVYSQESLLEVGKYGLHLIEDLKSKNLLVEQLSNRLRMIYNGPPCLTPDLSASEFAGIPLSSSNSFLSSIPGVSSGTVSPSYPQGVFGECLEKAEKEIARLDELVLAQGREIETLKSDLEEADSEREKFRQDRIKLKKDILELQVLLKRKDNSDSLMKVKDRLLSSMHAVSVQTQKIFSEHTDADTQTLSIARKAETFTQTARTEHKEVDVQTLNTSLDGGNDPGKKESITTQTERHARHDAVTQASREKNRTIDASTCTIAKEDDKIALLQQVIDDERILYQIEIDRLNHMLQEQVEKVATTSIGVGSEQRREFSAAINTDIVKVKEACLGPDAIVRFSSEWTQCDLIKTEVSESVIMQLSEENAKLREKYLKYRSEIAKRRNNVQFSVASGTDGTKFSVDRQTDMSLVSTIDSVVQVDDQRDEKLFILEADLRFAGEEKDALVAQIEEIETERDFAIEELEKIKNIAYDSDAYIRHLTDEISGLSRKLTQLQTKPSLVLESLVSTNCQPQKMRENSTVTCQIGVEHRTTSTEAKFLIDSAVGTHDSIKSLTQSVQAEDRSQLETIRALSEELIALRSKPVLDSEANTDFKSFSDAQSGPSGCFSSVESGVGPDSGDLSPTSELLYKLVTAETSTQVADKQLENEIIISLQKKLIRKEKLIRAKNEFIEYGFGKIQAHVSPARDNSLDISAIAKPLSNAASLTTCSPHTVGTFDYSISSLQHQALSSLSPKRIPFSTPDQLPKDPDGDVVMRTAPRTQIRNIPLGVGFPVHEDPVENLDMQENIELKKSLKNIRDKAYIAHSLSERIGALTSLAEKNRL